MEQNNIEAKVTAIFTDERGWQKPYQISEGVCWVGTAENAHIRLQNENGIAPYHLQIVNTHTETGVRLINLSGAEIILQKGDENTIFATGGIIDIAGPEILHLGSYTLHFQLDKQNIPQPATRENKQQMIGLRLVLPDVVLRPNFPLVGVLHLQNAGKEACQFKVEIDGFPAECYEITPPPLIYAGGEESTEIHFFHKKVAPPAGQHNITLRVTAPEVYPGEEVIIQQVLKVLPYYEQSISFAQPEQQIIYAAVPEELPAVPPPLETVPLTEEPMEPQPTMIEPATEPLPQTEPMQSSVLVSEPKKIQEPQAVKTAPPAPTEQGKVMPAMQPSESTDEGNTAKTIPVSTPVRKQKRPDLSSAKVMKANTGDFLDKRSNQE